MVYPIIDLKKVAHKCVNLITYFYDCITVFIAAAATFAIALSTKISPLKDYAFKLK